MVMHYHDHNHNYDHYHDHNHYHQQQLSLRLTFRINAKFYQVMKYFLSSFLFLFFKVV